MRPILRWAGAKTQILTKLASYYQDPKYKYIEPFCGSACLFLRLNPKRAVLGDMNSDLIGTYETVRSNPSDVHQAMQGWGLDAETYYKVRAGEGVHTDPISKAARFLYLNRLCFNGIYRTNLSGKFNVPWGATKFRAMLSLEELVSFSEALKGVKLVSGDFAMCLQRVSAKTFVYLDPPYRVTSKRTFREYLPAGFAVDDLHRLRTAIIRIHESGAKFVLSYADSAEARTLGDGFQTVSTPVRRLVAGSASSRTRVEELLISNIEISQ
ncbi:MAG: Dam family site-specific DNA-(adenine-N6)-methyltransferase [Chthonomonas sp.]|nr:Dam family site-specific DNA-(adenine-N6)-methyltransferase [Chthonomonas sp.]